MKRLIAALVPAFIVVTGVYANVGDIPASVGKGTQVKPSPVKVDKGAKVKPVPVKKPPVVSCIPKDSESDSESYSDASADATAIANVSVDNTSISEYEPRTQPLTVFPSNLPYWEHGGWGTIKAYFSNGPNNDNQVYERTFDPRNRSDMHELSSVLGSLSYDGPLGVLGGILNGVGVVFGGTNNYHHGKGFEIANSLVRTRRPRGKTLYVFIDSNVDRNLLQQGGYAYIGKVSLEGNVDRNWDQVYDAAVAEVLPWDVDILLVSGGMKGVTVGSNISFPGAGGAYSQANYSVSLFGSVSSGITEGKGKAVVSAEGYKFWPEVARRRKIPQSFYKKVQAGLTPRPSPAPRPAPSPAPRSAPSPELIPVPSPAPSPEPESEEPIQEASLPQGKEHFQGIVVSKRLWEMAGFEQHQIVQYVTVK